MPQHYYDPWAKVGQSMNNAMFNYLSSRPSPTDQAIADAKIAAERAAANKNRLQADQIQGQMDASGNIADIYSNIIGPYETPRPSADFQGPMQRFDVAPPEIRQERYNQNLPDLVSNAMQFVGDKPSVLGDTLLALMANTGGVTPDQVGSAQLGAGLGYDKTQAGFEADPDNFTTNLAPDNILLDENYKTIATNPKPAVPSAKEQQISRIMRSQGVDYTTASGIADGVISIAVDPVSGTPMLVNKATGGAVPMGQGSTPLNLPVDTSGQQSNLAPPFPTEPSPSVSLYDTAGDVGGLGGTLGEFYSDVVGQVLPIPDSVSETVEGRQDLRTAQNDLIRSLSVNPKFPVAEVKRLLDENPVAPKAGVSGESAQSKMRSLDRNLRVMMVEAQRDAANPMLPKNTRQAQAQSAAAIQNFLRKLDVPQRPATGGKKKSLEEIFGN